MDPKTVNTREELIGYISDLLDDHDAIGDQWENKDIYQFLQALAAWLNDCDGCYKNMNTAMDVEEATWQLFADSLSAASVYE
jgi:hypothetical protein